MNDLQTNKPRRTVQMPHGAQAWQLAGSMAGRATLVLFIGMLTWFAWSSAMQLTAVTSILQAIDTLLKPAYWLLRGSIAFWWSPLVLVAVPICLLLSWWRPVQKEPGLLSRGLMNDAAWSFSRTFVTVLLLAAYSGFLDGLATRHLGGALFTRPDLPLVVRGGLTFLFMDFLYWFRHLLLHKIPALWHFHAIHHSQEALNPFSIDRIHPGEFLFTLSLMFAPVFIVTRSLQVTVGYFLIWRAYDAFVHSNIRTNLGWLRFLVVTPQSHRVHHSRRTEHYDCNYGSVLAIWDWLFRTRHADCSVYPETGIPEPDFPRDGAGRNALQTVGRQLLYPFRALGLAGARGRS